MSHDKRFPYRVFRTKFHGGGLISRHATEVAAQTAVRRHKISDCKCGCAVVVGPGDEEPRDRSEDNSPYAPAA